MSSTYDAAMDAYAWWNAILDDLPQASLHVVHGQQWYADILVGARRCYARQLAEDIIIVFVSDYRRVLVGFLVQVDGAWVARPLTDPSVKRALDVLGVFYVLARG